VVEVVGSPVVEVLGSPFGGRRFDAGGTVILDRSPNLLLIKGVGHRSIKYYTLKENFHNRRARRSAPTQS
jgi:hypothetical protein